MASAILDDEAVVRTLKLSQLQKRALAAGASEREVDDAVDSVEPKEMLIQIVLARIRADGAAARTGPQGWRLLALALRALGWLVALGLLAATLHRAYSIRLYAINEFGTVIHEFDPWFNYRATEYLAEHGWRLFPLVRPLVVVRTH